MNFKEYKQYVEGLVIFSDMGFKVRKHWTSELSVDLLERGINHGSFIKFDKEAKDMSQVHFGNRDELFGALYLDSADAQTLFKVLTATSAFLNTPYEMRFKKKASASGNPVNNSETTKLFVSNDDSQKYFLKDRYVRDGYLQAVDDNVEDSIAEYLDSDGEYKRFPFLTVTKTKASRFTKKDLQTLYTFWLEKDISMFNDYELIKSSSQKYLVYVGMPQNAKDFIGQYTMGEIEKMKEDPKVAIDWNKATIEPVQDHEHRNWGYK